jgi:hypothetical protein
MNKMAMGQTAIKKEALAICQFNFLPIQYIHTSWLTTLPAGSMMERLRHCQRTAHRLSHYLLAHFKLENQYWFEFTNPVNRIALLNRDSLIKLVFYTGLTLSADAIRRAVRGCDVVNLKNAIGEEGYFFAVKRAPFFWPALEDVHTLPTDPYHLRQHLVLKGMSCLDALFCQRSLALTQRLWWKIPMGWRDSLRPSSPHTAKPETVALLLHKLIKELELT